MRPLLLLRASALTPFSSVAMDSSLTRTLEQAVAELLQEFGHVTHLVCPAVGVNAKQVLHGRRGDREPARVDGIGRRYEADRGFHRVIRMTGGATGTLGVAEAEPGHVGLCRAARAASGFLSV